MRLFLAMLVCLVIPLQACRTTPPPPSSASLNYSIYHLSGNGRDLVAKGKLDYTARDVKVTEWGNQDGHPSWKKSLELKDGFSLGILVVRKAPTGGFGLWIQNDRHPAGFSWEWFACANGDVFEKLQGKGQVRVTSAPHADGTEIQSVEFLADITLRFQEDVKAGPGRETHEVVVSKGSVLRIAS
jgi:hypothetical protein